MVEWRYFCKCRGLEKLFLHSSFIFFISRSIIFSNISRGRDVYKISPLRGFIFVTLEKYVQKNKNQKTKRDIAMDVQRPRHLQNITVGGGPFCHIGKVRSKKQKSKNET